MLRIAAQLGVARMSNYEQLSIDLNPYLVRDFVRDNMRPYGTTPYATVKHPIVTGHVSEPQPTVVLTSYVDVRVKNRC
jgi:hypothetical protein